MSEKSLHILNHDIKPGKHVVLELEIARLHTRNSLRIPIIVRRARAEGPVLLLMAGVHGDEINGVAIVRDLILGKHNYPERGTVICIPVLNVFGYLNRSREFPDGRDLNRVFPGSEKGSLASQFAHRFLKEIAPHTDIIIDFHTGGADRENHPLLRCQFDDADVMELAKVFNPPFIVHSKYIPKSLRESCRKLGKTMLLFEGGKSGHLDQEVIQCGKKGALNIMKHLGMISGALEKRHESVLIKKSKWLRSPHSGMLQLQLKNGSRFRKGDLLGQITDPYGAFVRKLHAPFDCWIFGANTSPIIHKGDALFHVSISRDSDREHAAPITKQLPEVSSTT